MKITNLEDLIAEWQKQMDVCLGKMNDEHEGIRTRNSYTAIHNTIHEFLSDLTYLKSISKDLTSKIEFYTKLLAKLNKLKSGDLTLDNYIEEVEFKVNHLSNPIKPFPIDESTEENDMKELAKEFNKPFQYGNGSFGEMCFENGWKAYKQYLKNK